MERQPERLDARSRRAGGLRRTAATPALEAVPTALPPDAHRHQRALPAAGGGTPRGLDHPRTKISIWSNALPNRLAGYLEAALADPAIVSLVDHIALTDARHHRTGRPPARRAE